ncbi:MAG: membrane fusion protein [Oleiphilaceae bacterium]|jgi:membrane fusion protein
MDIGEEKFFRKEAVATLSVRNLGRPIARMPRVWLYFGLFILGIIVFVAWYLVSSHYSRKEIAVGWLVPDKGVVSITSGRYGVVSNVNVVEGQFVSAHEQIVSLAFDGSLIGPASTTDSLLKEMATERNEIKRQINILKQSVVLEKTQIINQAEALTKQLINIHSQVDYQNEIIDIEKELLTRILKLSSEGSISTLELQRQRESLALQEQTLLTLNQNITKIEGEKKQLLTHAKRLPLDHEKSESELNTRMSELAQRETELLSRNKRVITSPIDGTVAWLGAKPGSSITPNTTLISIIPKDTNLFAEVFIPSSAIGFIEIGKGVRVMFDAFPHQRFGSSKGTVSHVGRVALSADEFPKQIKIDSAAYRARIQLEKQSINAFGKQFSFRPGMTLRAEIILENRTFLQWLLEPVLARRKRQQLMEEETE